MMANIIRDSYDRRPTVDSGSYTARLELTDSLKNGFDENEVFVSCEKH